MAIQILVQGAGSRSCGQKEGLADDHDSRGHCMLCCCRKIWKTRMGCGLKNLLTSGKIISMVHVSCKNQICPPPLSCLN